MRKRQPGDPHPYVQLFLDHYPEVAEPDEILKGYQETPSTPLPSHQEMEAIIKNDPDVAIVVEGFRKAQGFDL